MATILLKRLFHLLITKFCLQFALGVLASRFCWLFCLYPVRYSSLAECPCMSHIERPEGHRIRVISWELSWGGRNVIQPDSTVALLQWFLVEAGKQSAWPRHKPRPVGSGHNWKDSRSLHNCLHVEILWPRNMWVLVSPLVPHFYLTAISPVQGHFLRAL